MNVIFSHQENKVSYTSIPKISIYLFTHFHSFHFISAQFADFAFLKIQMHITFVKSVDVLNLVNVVNKNFDWLIIL